MFVEEFAGKCLKKITRAPSLREIPVILILGRKNKKTIENIKRICNFEVFDYVTEPFFEMRDFNENK